MRFIVKKSITKNLQNILPKKLGNYPIFSEKNQTIFR